MTLQQLQRAQDAKLDDVRVAQEKNAQNERLAQDNARLAEQLEEYKSASSRVSELEKENERLAASLQQALLLPKDIRDTGGLNEGGKDARSIANDPSPATRQIDYDDSKAVKSKPYRTLVTRYNILYENWNDIKAARKRLESEVRRLKEKDKQYQQFCDSQGKKIDKKRDRIRRLEEELGSLKAQMQSSGQPNISKTAPRSSVQAFDSHDQHRLDPKGLQEVARALNSAPLAPIHYRGKVITIDDIVRVLEVFNNKAEVSHRIEVPASSLSGELRSQSAPLPGPDTSSREQATRSNKSAGPECESNKLPVLFSGEIDGNGRVADTEFECIEPHHSSSTQDCSNPNSPSKDDDQDPKIKKEPSIDTRLSPDTPMVISARRANKRKDRNEPETVSKIKIETISSSPIGLAAFHGLDQSESIDLDDIGDKQITPRKQRQSIGRMSGARPYGAYSARQDGNDNQDHDDLSDIIEGEQVFQETPVPRARRPVNSALRPLSANKQIMPRTSENQAPKRRRLTSNKAVEELAEDGENLRPIEKTSRKRDTASSAERLGDLLEKPTPPKHAISQARRSVLTKSPLCPSNAPSTLNPTLDPARRTGTPDRVSTPSGPSSKGPLRDFMEPSTPASRDSAYVSLPQSREDISNHYEGRSKAILFKGLSRVSAELSRPPTRSSVGATDVPRSLRSLETPNDQSAIPSKPSTTKKRSSRARGEQHNLDLADYSENEPLRARPLEKLSLQDFKINPNYNHGYNYAFADVVRNQDARRCLQGCTKPECCGNKFRALAAAARDPNKPLTASQEEDDARLLEEFMGDNSYKLRNMTKAERDETLLQARTRELANKHGRHRHAYERRRSPPGFWRVEFPTTQEEIEDREKSKQLERDLVAQRYEEAMRPGGAYIFRDE